LFYEETLIKMDSCKYTTKYFDYKKKEPAIFRCDEEALNAGLCVYHDSKFENNEELITRLVDKTKKLSKNEELFCIGYKIPKITLSGSISEPVYFTRANISNADFSGAKFENVDFSGAKLKNVNFSGANFVNADFLAVNFNGITNFSNTCFKNKVNFSESIFNEANFNDSSMNRAQFLGTKFQIADFGLAKMVDSDFFGAIFEQSVSFIGAELNGCKFPNAKFQNIATFTGAKLNKTNFPKCNFNKVNFDNASLQVVVLQNTIFLDNATFTSSELEKVDFFKANFKKDIIFTDSNLREVTFSEASIHGLANFVKATLHEGVKFKKLEINRADFTDAKFEGRTFFHDVLFNNQDKVIFDVHDLSKVSFMNTNVTKVRFGEKVRWAGENGFMIIDEETLNDSTDEKKLESIIATYRMLKKNYEDRYRFEEANKFLAREIELKKKYIKEGTPLNITELELLEKKLSKLIKDMKT